jgi:putative ABC transport system permease protein
MTRIYLKLAFAGIGNRRLQSALTVLVIAATAGALMLAVNVARVADRPFERTFAATNGAHVWVMGPPGADVSPAAHLSGVVDSTGVLPLAFGSFRHDGKRFGIGVTGVGASPARVARPLVVEGRWPGRHGVLLEQSFGRFLGLHSGDRIVVSGVPLVVSGLAVVAQGEAYPKTQPGKAIALRETVEELPRAQLGHMLGLRIAQPLNARRFTFDVRQAVPNANVSTWLEERDDARVYTKTAELPLRIFSVLLLVAGGLVLGTLVGGRVISQVRELGLLKAAGLGPSQVASVLVIEQLAIGAVGVLVGIVVGTIATPAFVTASASLLNASETPSFDPVRALAVGGIVLVATGVLALIPSIRIARRTTMAVLAAGTAPSHGARRPSRLPLVVALGLRDAFANRGRAALVVLALSLSVGTIVGSIGMERSLRVASKPPPAPVVAGTPQWDPVDNDAGEGARLRPVIYAFDGVLVFVGGVNLLATLMLALRRRVRDLGVLKAVGVTPRELARSSTIGYASYGALAALVGIPLGIALLKLVFVLTDSNEYAYPWWWSLVLLVPAAALVVAAITAPLARRAASISVVDALRYE